LNEKEIRTGIATALANRRVIDRVFVGNERSCSASSRRISSTRYQACSRRPAGTDQDHHRRTMVDLAADAGDWKERRHRGRALLPYWEGISVQNSLGFLQRSYANVQQEFLISRSSLARRAGLPKAAASEMPKPRAPTKPYFLRGVRPARDGKGLRLLSDGGLTTSHGRQQ